MRVHPIGVVSVLAACTVEDPTSSEQVVAVTLVQSVQGTPALQGDAFGGRVAVSRDGSTLVVGADGESSCATGVNGTPSPYCAPYSGAAYVFARGEGSWTQTAFLKQSDTTAYSYFGGTLAVSADGTTIAVGAQGVNRNGAYVFVRSHAGWSQQLLVPGYGSNVALSADGSTLVVSAATDPNPDPYVEAAGVIAVYTRTGIRWSQQATLRLPDPAYYDQLGATLALSDDGLLIAAGCPGRNAVFLFRRDRRQWIPANTLTASDSRYAIGFGSRAIAFTPSGTSLAISAPYDAGGGSVHVFAASSQGWTEEALLLASNRDPDDGFGFSVANAAGMVLVGAIGESSSSGGDPLDNAAPTSGAAYMFQGGVQTDYLKSPTIAAYTQYARSVALSGDGGVVAVGQPYLGSGITFVYGAP